MLGCVAAMLMGVVKGGGVYHRHQRHGHAEYEGRPGLPFVGVRVGVGVGGDVEHPRVQRQQSLTTKAIRTSCDTLATSSSAAIDKVNVFVKAYQPGPATGPTEGPAIDALNDSASTVGNALNDAMSLGSAGRIQRLCRRGPRGGERHRHARATGEFNKRVDQLNDTKTKALKLCLASF